MNLALSALKVLRTLAHVQIGIGLLAHASVLTRVRIALVDVYLAQSSGETGVALTRVARGRRHTGAIDARIGQAIVDLRLTVEAGVAGQTRTGELGGIATVLRLQTQTVGGTW